MDFKEQLKDAICSNDIDFLEKNRDRYSINERFEDENNDTLLLYSISDKSSLIYQYFLKNNANLFLINNANENIIHAIVYSNCTNRLLEVIDKVGLIINDKDSSGATPLLLSISLGYFEMAKLLIENGANVNICDNEGIYPIHIASQFGSLDFIKILLKNGAYLNLKTKKGNYPFALAVNADNYQVVKFLYNEIYCEEKDM